MNKEVEAYKLFRQLEVREKRANLYKFYDKDELIDEILKSEDKIEELENINEKISLALESAETKLKQKENKEKEIREYIKQLLEYKKEDYYKGVSLDYVERILDILKGFKI